MSEHVHGWDCDGTHLPCHGAKESARIYSEIFTANPHLAVWGMIRKQGCRSCKAQESAITHEDEVHPILPDVACVRAVGVSGAFKGPQLPQKYRSQRTARISEQRLR